MSTLTYKHYKYLKISIYHCNLASERSEKLKKKFYNLNFINKFILIKKLQQYLLNRMLNVYKDCSDDIDISISMSAFSIEAYINYYAIFNGLDKLQGFDEKMRTFLKWQNYPRQVTGMSLPADILQMVQEVLNDRNEIAHYKPKVDQNGYSAYSLKTAYENLNKVYKIYESLMTIDSKVKFQIFQFIIPEKADKISLEYAAIIL